MRNLIPTLICLFLVVPSQAGIIYVYADANGANDGSGWANAYNYLQDALAAASSGDKIWVAEGIYTPDSNSSNPNGSGDRTATFQLKNGVAIYGGFSSGGCEWEESDPNAYETILSGDIGNEGDDLDNCYHVVTGADEATLDGFTITGGRADGRWQDGYMDGAGILCFESSPTISNCVIRENSAGYLGYGGGMCSDYGSPTVTNCTFRANSAGNAGGAMLTYYSDATVTNCTFSENTTDNVCGGMFNWSSSPTLINCMFSGNRARYGGGGMLNVAESNPTLTNCIFKENRTKHFGGGGMYNTTGSNPTLISCIFVGNWTRGYSGGGMFNVETSPTLINCMFCENSSNDAGGAMLNYESRVTLTGCVFSGNSAKNKGGGMYNYGGAPRLTNCTVSGNQAGKSGGGMLNYGSSPVLTNCIFWGNDAGGNYDEIHSGASSEPMVIYSDIKGGYVGEGNIDADPCFVEPGYRDANDTPDDVNDDFWVEGDYHLLPDSPCIDTGDPNYVPEPNETDLDGNPRVRGDAIDMGAYETIIHEARLLILPRVINRKSSKPRIMAWLRLPQGITKDQIDRDVPLVLYPSGIEAMRQFVIPRRRQGTQRVSIFAFFNKAELMDAIDDNGRVELQILGRLRQPGQYFYGSDTIRIKPRR
jgi:hypothetical protein